jgi:hypothetical protein
MSESESSTEDEEYIVESIEKMRLNNGQREFHVKWQGYTRADSTWEPEINLSSASEMVARFMSTHQSTGSPSLDKTDSPRRSPRSSPPKEPKITIRSVGRPVGASAKTKKRESLAAKKAMDSENIFFFIPNRIALFFKLSSDRLPSNHPRWRLILPASNLALDSSRILFYFMCARCGRRLRSSRPQPR